MFGKTQKVRKKYESNKELFNFFPLEKTQKVRKKCFYNKSSRKWCSKCSENPKDLVKIWSTIWSTIL